MPVSKLRRAHLIRIQKIERQAITPVVPAVNLSNRNNTDTSDTNDTDTGKDEASGWYWHDSSKEDFSDSDNDLSSKTEKETEDETEGEEETLEKELMKDTLMESSQMDLKWNDDGKAKLRGAWGKSSLATEKRRQKEACDRQQQAAQCLHIGDMFKKAQEKLDQIETSETSQVTVMNKALPRACARPVSRKQAQINCRRDTLRKLNRLMTFVTKQEDKYRYRLSPRSNFYQRHLMVKHFLSSQDKKLSRQTQLSFNSELAPELVPPMAKKPKVSCQT